MRTTLLLLAVALAAVSFEVEPGPSIGRQSYPTAQQAVADAWKEKLVASDATVGAKFGWSVAMDGDLAAVGAPGALKAYLFSRIGGHWKQRQALSEPADSAGVLGWSVAVSGSTIVVGERGGVGPHGTARVFVPRPGRDGLEMWRPQATLIAADAAGGTDFGWSVAISGDTVIVGAPAGYAIQKQDPSAYVFVRSGSNWAQQAKLVAASGGDLNSGYGWSVAVSGDTAVVGAPRADVAGQIDAGAAYVLRRHDGTWTQEGKLTPGISKPNELFGVAVAIYGDRLLVGAPQASEPPSGAGGVYVFGRLRAASPKRPCSGSDPCWIMQGKLTAASGTTGDDFGCSVALTGDRAAVGAGQGSHAGGIKPPGYAVWFQRAPRAWERKSKLTASDAEVNDGFGASVAISNSGVIVAAPLENPGGVKNAGSAYAFMWSQPAPATSVSGLRDATGIAVAPR